MVRNKLGKAGLVVAVAAACGYASAATITKGGGYIDLAGVNVAAGTNISAEGARAGAVGKIPLQAVTVVTGDFYNVGDVIQLTLDNGARFNSHTVSQPSVSCAGTASGTDANLVVSLSQLQSASDTIRAQVTSISGATQGISCTFTSLSLVTTSLTSGVTKISSGTRQNGTSAYNYDASSASLTVLSVATQVSSVSVLSALNGVIDFQSSLGYGFATDDNAGYTAGSATFAGKGDALTIAVGNKADGMYATFTGTVSVSFTLAAESGKNFAWLDDLGCTAAGELNRSTSNGRVGISTGNATIGSACAAISYVGQVNLTGAAQVVGLEFGHKSATPSTGLTIDPMTFPSMSVSLQQGSTALGSATAVSPGAWTSNGSVIHIPYMPVNTTAGASKIDPVVSIMNRSSATGTLTATMRDEDGNLCTADNLGTIGPNRTKAIGGLLRDAAAACTNLNAAGGEKLYITVTATLPDTTTVVYSGYTVGGSRSVTVVNNSNGK